MKEKHRSAIRDMTMLFIFIVPASRYPIEAILGGGRRGGVMIAISLRPLVTGGVKVPKIQTRQGKVLREDLQHAHPERINPVTPISTESRPAKGSSKNRT